MKKEVEAYWSLPQALRAGIDIPLGLRPFYDAIDEKRFRLEPYVPKLIGSLECAGQQLLEVGCGNGTDLRQFARLGAKVVAIDLTKTNARISKGGLKIYGLEGEVLVADAENLPFRDSSFNLVYSFGVLHHTPNTQKTIHEIHRILKHGGRTLTMLYHKGLSYYWIILRYGFLSFELFRLPMEKLISKRYDHTPLSKMYTRKQVKRMFRQFSNITLDCLNFGGIQVHPQLKNLWKFYTTFPILEKIFGSFLIILAKKGS